LGKETARPAAVEFGSPDLFSPERTRCQLVPSLECIVGWGQTAGAAGVQRFPHARAAKDLATRRSARSRRTTRAHQRFPESGLPRSGSFSWSLMALTNRRPLSGFPSAVSSKSACTQGYEAICLQHPPVLSTSENSGILTQIKRRSKVETDQAVPRRSPS
jgi:hypothetical protein